MSGIHLSFCFTASRILFSLKFLASFSGSHEEGRGKKNKKRDKRTPLGELKKKNPFYISAEHVFIADITFSPMSPPAVLTLEHGELGSALQREGSHAIQKLIFSFFLLKNPNVTIVIPAIHSLYKRLILLSIFLRF